MIKIKRVYANPSEGDGFRILVDRIWPRGLKKSDAYIDAWFKAAAPSTDLRKWFNHDPKKWAEFQKRYEAELTNNEAIPELLMKIKAKKNVTLLYSAGDENHNQAIVLRHFLERQSK